MKAVYRLRNKRNGREYIGSSSNIAHRKSQWRDWKNCCNNPRLRADFEADGFAGFDFEILFECPEDWNRHMVEEKEYSFIRKIKPYYNTIGKARPEDVRRKLMLANSGKKQSEEVKRKRHESIVARHAVLPQTNFGHKILVWIEDMNTLCVGMDAAGKLIGCNPTTVVRRLRKSITTIKGHKVSYFSVETSGDECSRVGMRMSCIPKCEAPIDGEEIVHSWTMIKPRGNDKGVIDLCYRSGEVTYINAEVVYANDEFDYGMGLDPYLKHRPFEGEDPGPAVKYYAVFKTKSGASLFKVWSREKVEAHAKRFSKSYNAKEGEFYGPWATDFDAMAKKTVLIDVLNYAPKKSDFARALAAEGSVKTEISKDMSQVRDENVIDAEYEEVQRSGGAETVQSDKEKAEALADSLGMKRGSDLASKNGGDEDLGDVE